MKTANIRLREIREKLGLTQTQLGERIGLKWSQIKDMEIGVVNVRPIIAKILYHEFSVNPDWLLHGKGEMFIDKSKERLDIISEKVILILKDMDEDKRRDVLKYAEEKKLLMDILKEKRKKAG